MEKSTKIGVLGSGMVGQQLSAGFVKYGFETTIGTRNSDKLLEWSQGRGKGVKVASFEVTAANADIIILGVKGTVAMSLLASIPVADLNGKIIIDATNPIAEEGPEDGVLRFFTEQNTSLMEQLQQAFPEVRFVKAFNSVGSAFMVNPDFGGIKPTMFICGDYDDAKREVRKILDMFGWETEDMGTAKAAGPIEALCMLWCIPGFRENRWSHAFKLLKK